MRPCLLIAALLLGCPPASDDDSVAVDCQDLASTAMDPSVTIVAPTNPYSTQGTENISWIVEVEDEDTEPADLTMRLYDTMDISPVDIDADVPAPDSSGRVEFVLAASLLGPGAHPLHMEATDPDGCYGEAQVVVCIDRQTCP
jgi:hypothetical protein